jgi:hypothetical protein
VIVVDAISAKRNNVSVKRRIERDCIQKDTSSDEAYYVDQVPNNGEDPQNRRQAMTEKNHDKFARWLNKGIEAGFCSLPVCDTHDGLPLEEWEFAYLDEGVDLCATVVRLNGPYAPVKEDVDAVFGEASRDDE